VSRRLLLALDAGTTGARALVVDTSTSVLASAYEELTVECPQPGWVELDPAKLWQSVRRVIAEALRAADARADEVAAVGIANQRATTLLWERATGAPVHPAIVWQDVRTAARVGELLQQGFFVNTMASSTKLEWLLDHTERGRGRAARGELCFGTVDSWLAWNLSGGRLHITDPSNASCTGLYDFASGEWDARGLELLDIPPSVLPAIIATCGRHGMTEEKQCGFTAPLAAIAGDQQASMFGLARHRPGDFKVTFGTSGMVDVNTGSAPVLSASGAYPLVLWQLGGERSFCLEGTAITAGAAIQWLRDGIGIIESAAETGRIAESIEDCGGVWVVPAFQGLGTPYMDPRARATIGGLSRASSRAHVVRATLEGVSFRCREVVVTLAADIGAALPALVRADGGAAENDFLLQHLADVLGVAVERPETVQGTALGAALLAGMGIGVWRDAAEMERHWRRGAVFEPRWSEARRDEEYTRWRGALQLSYAR